MTQHHVVAGVDGSVASVRALDRTAEEAHRRECVLRVPYAAPDRDKAEPILEAALAGSITVTQVCRSHPWSPSAAPYGPSRSSAPGA